MSYLIDNRGNIIGSIESTARSVNIASGVSDTRKPVNVRSVRVSNSRSTQAKAARTEDFPARYVQLEGHDVFVPADVLASYESAADRVIRIADEAKEKAAADERAMWAAAGRRQESNERFAADIAARLED